MPTTSLPRRVDVARERFAGSEHLKTMLDMQGNPSYAGWWDDFFGDALDGRYTAAGTGTEVIGVTAGINGTATLTTGASANDSAGMGLGLHWNGDNGCYMAARLQVETLTDIKFEVGFTDATNDDTGAVNAKATPTFTATDCAVFVYDTADDTNLTFVTNGGAVDGNTDYGAISATTYYIFEVKVVGDTAQGWINGVFVGSGNIEGGNPLTPWLYVETNTTATRTMTVDWLTVVGSRF